MERLDTILRDVSPNLKSVALLNRDVDETPADAGAIYLPVPMIENLLVDPDVNLYRDSLLAPQSGL